jgi:nucleotide-binding universal stress UspA family protein
MKYTPEIKKILVPISNGVEGTLVLKYAMAFQETYDCEIILLHVIKEAPFLRRLTQADKLQKKIKRAEEELKCIVSDLFGVNLPAFINMKVEVGDDVEIILSTAQENKCDLVIKTKKKPIIRRLRFQKNEDKLISVSTCPILTIPANTFEKGINDILIPVDIRKKVDAKIAWVKCLALKFNAKVHIVYVLDIDIAPNSSLAYQKALKIEKSMKEVGLETKVLLLKSKGRAKHDVILSHIKELKPDFVLMMTHQESILFENYIGEFATEVIHKSISPIFSLVPRRETLMTKLMEPIISPNKSSDILI